MSWYKQCDGPYVCCTTLSYACTYEVCSTVSSMKCLEIHTHTYRVPLIEAVYAEDRTLAMTDSNDLSSSLANDM